VAIAAGVTLRIVGRLPRGIDAVAAKHVLTYSLPLFALSALTLVHAKLDEIMLAALTSYEQVASYAASYKLLEVSRFVVRPLGMVLFPLFVAAAAAGDWRKYRDGARHVLLGAGAVGLVLLALLVPAAPFIVPTVYGDEYRSSIEIAQILFLATPALFIGQVALFLANSLYLDRVAILVTALGVLGNAGINLVAIPRWGAVGAAWTTFATETFVALSLVSVVLVCLRRKQHDAAQSIDLTASRFDAGV
jgi:O-antigen/teichoic acid export membrane protein